MRKRSQAARVSTPILPHEVTREALETPEVELLFQIADAMRDSNLWPLAARYYDRILEIRLRCERAHSHYAALLMAQGRDEQAL